MNLTVDSKKLALLVAAVLAVIYRDQVIASLLPFFAAFLLAGLLEPIVNWLQRKGRVPRSAAVGITLASFVFLSGYLLTIAFARIAAELLGLAKALPAFQRQIVLLADDLIRTFNEFYQNAPPELTGYLHSAADNLSRWAVSVMNGIIQRTLGAITGLPALAVVLIVTVLSTYFILKDKAALTRAVLGLAPLHWRQPLDTATDKIGVDLVGFMKALLLLLVMTTAVAAVGLYLIGTQYWLSLAILLGVLDLIPVLGPGLILFPWAALSLLLGDPELSLYLLALFAAQFALRQIAQAKILGDSIGIHPLAMLVALYAGIVLFGVKGLFIGPVLVIVGRALWNAGLLPRSESQEL